MNTYLSGCITMLCVGLGTTGWDLSSLADRPVYFTRAVKVSTLKRLKPSNQNNQWIDYNYKHLSKPAVLM